MTFTYIVLVTYFSWMAVIISHWLPLPSRKLSGTYLKLRDLGGQAGKIPTSRKAGSHDHWIGRLQTSTGIYIGGRHPIKRWALKDNSVGIQASFTNQGVGPKHTYRSRSWSRASLQIKEWISGIIKIKELVLGTLMDHGVGPGHLKHTAYHWYKQHVEDY